MSPNRLAAAASPYLLQHAQDPVDWYPWCEEAFDTAQQQGKAVFLSIGYSACHWCHVMARESFADPEVAALLNRYFVSIKVDREERPDIDHVYMEACQLLSGSGGWPLSIFMTPEQKPFFAGTYFPKEPAFGRNGFRQLVQILGEAWQNDPHRLAQAGDKLTAALSATPMGMPGNSPEEDLPQAALEQLRQSYDPQCGGFGEAPKFPSPANILFLLTYYQKRHEKTALAMAEHTLQQMYRGGIFDHIGYGFCRYSTDRYFLVPHFEKMFQDNALLTLCYAKAYTVTQNRLYLHIAGQIAAYILREGAHPEGGVYTAQDADSEGEEGKYYLLTAEEILDILGPETGKAFNDYYNITPSGNFQGKNIANLLPDKAIDFRFNACLPQILAYRQSRFPLLCDDKILTAVTAAAAAAFAFLARAGGGNGLLTAAEKAWDFIHRYLRREDALYVSYRQGHRGVKGLCLDYAACMAAGIFLYQATWKEKYLNQAQAYARMAVEKFFDAENGGFFISGSDGQDLIYRPKETWDGAGVSGNALMTCGLVILDYLCPEHPWGEVLSRQIAFMKRQAQAYPAAYPLFLTALLHQEQPSPKAVIVPEEGENLQALGNALPPALWTRLIHGDRQYPPVNGKTTFYICQGGACLPPQNDIPAFPSV
ncbi:MAG: thioredoxin domain-containing protein [Firmicutes bacterium]|nr:thioredoxin domain-containing protein [Bacillota bacterium]